MIASLVGTKAVLDPEDAALVAGFIVNKFRGDPSLFVDGMEAIVAGAPAGRRSAWCRISPTSRHLPAEDALALDQRAASAARTRKLKVAVPILPQIANFDDLDPLEAEPDVELVRVAARRGAAGRCRSGHPAGLEVDHRRSRGACAKAAWTSTSPRMCGAAGTCSACAAAIRCSAGRSPIRDGIEGPPATVAGLGLLDVDDHADGDKTLAKVGGDERADGAPFTGYEMHMGATTGPDCARPLLQLADGTPRRRGLGERPRASAPMCTACSPMTASAPRGCAARRRCRRRLAYEADVEATLDRARRASRAHVHRSRPAAQPRTRDEQAASSATSATHGSRRRAR